MTSVNNSWELRVQRRLQSETTILTLLEHLRGLAAEDDLIEMSEAIGVAFEHCLSLHVSQSEAMADDDARRKTKD